LESNAIGIYTLWLSMAKQNRSKRFTNWARHSIYTFPIVIVIFLFILTTLQINGSSSGYYHSILYGSKSDDPELIYGQPQNIRSDEFLTASPLTALQYRTDFPQFNSKLGTGRDVAILPDAPTKSWLASFRPQNWAFFVIPFENAFAYRWWFGLALVIISLYFLALRILDRNKKLSILLSIAFGLSPFLLWWYQSSLFIPMAYSFMIIILGIRIIKQEKIPGVNSVTLANILYVLALSYLGASFVLFLYAPFLIPLFIVIAAFLLGYLANERFTKHSISTRNLLSRLGLMLAPLLLIAPIVLLFAIENKSMIDAIANSEYPGHRVVHSGELGYSPLFPIIGSFLMPLLQTGARGAHYYANQSEASNFILLLPFLIIPGIVLQVLEYKRYKRINYVFLSIQLVTILFIFRISLHFGDKFYNLLLLNKVPNNRLQVGLGIAGFLQLLYVFKLLPKLKMRGNRRTIFAVFYGLICLAVLLLFTLYVRNKYAIFAQDWYKLVLLAFAFTSILVLILTKRLVLAAALLLGFTLISSFRILPIYHGLNFIYDSTVVKKIEAVSKPSDSWVVVDNFTFENLPLAAGRDLINGAQIYSDLNFWHQLDKSGQYEYVYNRQAHALFVSNTAEPDKYFREGFARINGDLELYKGNVFKVKFDCSEFVYNNVDFVLTTHQLNFPCVEPVDKVSYPNIEFYIYKIQPVK
jgi:hypothetical protein